MSKNTIIVTGGCGYIGSHTIIALLEHTDFEVVSVDNFINSSVRTLERIKAVTGKTITNYDIDLCEPAAFERLLEQLPNVLAVIHFAALKSVPESVEKPLLYYQNNLESLRLVLEATATAAVPYLIFSSSCSVYGNVADLPVDETTALAFAESPYAYTKQISERMISDFTSVSPYPKAVSLRYFNPVGAHISGKNGEDPINPPTSLVPIITRTAIGMQKEMKVFGDDYQTRDGSCVRDYIHVSDIADAHIKALYYLIENDKKGIKSLLNEVFNLGTGNGVTVLEAIAAFEQVSGQRLNYQITGRRDGDVEAIYSDSTKAYKKLGWKPQYTIHEMMQSAWKWQQLLHHTHK
ncbi:MAG: UDP-glucose 4-epimerase GalE [Bernardetiaceae bacterium]|nr:UDP-glucose 4-epimerase GalE [Bernardetiaceae bacterium]